MEESKDAFGKLLLDYYQGKNGLYILEREDNYVEVCNADVYFSKYKDWSDLEKKSIRYAKGQILDIGCGVGRHSLYLQQKGYNVLAIDNSPLAVEVCKMRGVKNTKISSSSNLNFQKNSYDTVLLLGGNFGLGGTPEGTNKMLKQLHNTVKPEGIIIASSRDPTKTTDPYHLNYHEFKRKRKEPIGQIRMRVRYKSYIGDWFNYLFVTPNEMEKMAKETGWKIKSIFKPEQRKAGGYIAILKKN